VSTNQAIVTESIREQKIQQTVSGDTLRNTQIIIETTNQTIVDSATEFKGQLTTKETCIIQGRMIGNVSASKIILEAGSSMTGDITATAVIIHGTLNGNIQANDILLSSQARVSGNLIYDTLSAERGSQINASLKCKVPAQIKKTRMPQIDEAFKISNILAESS